MNDENMKWISQRHDPSGKIVSGHWRRQKPAMTAEQKLDKQRQQLVEQAKAEQRDEGLL